MNLLKRPTSALNETKLEPCKVWDASWRTAASKAETNEQASVGISNDAGTSSDGLKSALRCSTDKMFAACNVSKFHEQRLWIVAIAFTKWHKAATWHWFLELLNRIVSRVMVFPFLTHVLAGILRIASAHTNVELRVVSSRCERQYWLQYIDISWTTVLRQLSLLIYNSSQYCWLWVRHSVCAAPQNPSETSIAVEGLTMM